MLAAGAEGFISKSGDTMTGVLTLIGNPQANLDAATKVYVDNAEADAKTYSDSKIAAATVASEAYADQSEEDAKAYTDINTVPFTKENLIELKSDQSLGKYETISVGGLSTHTIVYSGKTIVSWKETNSITQETKSYTVNADGISFTVT